MAKLSQNDLIEKVCDLIQLGTSTRKEVNNLLKKIGQRDRPIWKKRSPLIEAVKKGNKSLVNGMIYGFGFDINSTTLDRDSGEWCALVTAILHCNFDFAKYLLASKNIDLTIKNTILKDSIYFNNIEAVKFILNEIGADVNAEMWYEENSRKPFLPLHFAISMDANK
jgi:hypothetical protein